MNKTKIFKWQTNSGTAVHINNTTLTPQSQSLTLRHPWGGFVWNRPVAVQVERDGEMERVPIIDVTRMVLLLFGAVGMVTAVAVGITKLASQKN